MPFRSRHILSSDAIWAPRKAGRTSLVPRTMECWKGQTNQWDVPTKLCYWTLVAMSWFLTRKASHLLFLISKGRKKLTIIILYPDDSWSGLLLSYYRATKTTFQKESGTAYHWPLVNSACCWAGPLVGHIPYQCQRKTSLETPWNSWGLWDAETRGEMPARAGRGQISPRTRNHLIPTLHHHPVLPPPPLHHILLLPPGTKLDRPSVSPDLSTKGPLKSNGLS